MRRKTISIVLIVLSVILLIAGFFLARFFILNSLDAYKENLENRFSGFAPDDDVVVVWHDKAFYFTDHDLLLWNVIGKNEEVKDGGYLFWNNNLYFVTYKDNGWLKDYSLLIYVCDMYGNNKKLLYERKYNEELAVTGFCGVFYLEFENSIDTYNVETGEYETLATGNDLELSDYITKEKKYSWKRNDSNGITVTDTQQDVSYTITDTMLRNGELATAIDGLDYSFHSVQIVDDRIYMMYRIEPHFFLLEQPFFVCEYDVNTNELRFKTFVYANEYTQITIDHRTRGKIEDGSKPLKKSIILDF